MATSPFRETEQTQQREHAAFSMRKQQQECYAPPGGNPRPRLSESACTLCLFRRAARKHKQDVRKVHENGGLMDCLHDVIMIWRLMIWRLMIWHLHKHGAAGIAKYNSIEKISERVLGGNAVRLDCGDY